MKTKNLMFALFFVSLVFSCQKENEVTTAPKSTESEVYKRILSAGFKKKSIVEYKDYYLVEGDIVFNKNKVSRTLKHTGTYYVYVYSNNFTYLNQSTYDANIALATETACMNYCANFSGIHFEIADTPGDADIRIDNAPQEVGYACGAADFPDSSGYPGHNIYINDWYVNEAGTTSNAQLVFLIMHELGHTIGLMHTNDSNYGTYIDGTPTSDEYSLMNSNTCGNTGGFSTGDMTAINTLYPGEEK